MARPRNAIPQLHFHSASGQFRVNVPGGKPKYFGREEVEANRLYRVWAAEFLLSQADGSPAHRQRGALSVSECCLAYLCHAKERYGPGGSLDRVKSALRVLDHLYGPVAAADFGPRSLKALRQHSLTLPSRLRPSETLSRNYVNSLVRAIKTAWVWLESEEMIPPGSAHHLATVKALRQGDGGRETNPVLPVEPWIVAATLPFLTPILQAMVTVHQLTGMRPAELCRLRRCEMTCSPEETLEPVKNLKVAAVDADGVRIWFYCPAQHKTQRKGKHRVIAIGPQAQAILSPLVEGRPADSFLFTPLESLRQANAIRAMTRERGPYPKHKVKDPRTKRRVHARYSTTTYAGAVERAADKADRAEKERARKAGLEVDDAIRLVPHWAPNQLRHHVATEVNEEADLDTAAAVLGHSSPQTTLVYALQAIRKAAALMARIG